MRALNERLYTVRCCGSCAHTLWSYDNIQYCGLRGGRHYANAVDVANVCTKHKWSAYVKKYRKRRKG